MHGKQKKTPKKCEPLNKNEKANSVQHNKLTKTWYRNVKKMKHEQSEIAIMVKAKSSYLKS